MGAAPIYGGEVGRELGFWDLEVICSGIMDVYWFFTEVAADFPGCSGTLTSMVDFERDVTAEGSTGTNLRTIAENGRRGERYSYLHFIANLAPAPRSGRGRGRRWKDDCLLSMTHVEDSR